MQIQGVDEKRLMRNRKCPEDPGSVLERKRERK